MKVTTVVIPIVAIAAGCVEASAVTVSRVTTKSDVRVLHTPQSSIFGFSNNTHGVVTMPVTREEDGKSRHHNRCPTDGQLTFSSESVPQVIPRDATENGQDELGDIDDPEEVEQED